MENYHEYEPSLEDLRNWKKSSIETFTFILENKFDRSLQDLILSYEEDLNSLKQNRKNIDNLYLDDFHSNKEIIGDYFFHLQEIEERLKSLIEMKIVYAFKSIEINIKEILFTSFEIENSSSLFQWKSIEMFLKNKNIDLKKIAGYNEVYQLKQANNSIKHSEYFEDKTLKTMFSDEEINEFSSRPFDTGKMVTYEILLNFYNRIEPYIIIFLESLCDNIYKELYEFNDQKLNDIADKLTLRMEKEDALLLIQKIKQNYQ